MNNPTWLDVGLTAIEYVAAWMNCNEIDLPLNLIAGIAAVKFHTGQELPDIQDEYNTRLYSTMDDYTATERPITAFRNAFKRVVYEGFFAAGQAGWIDAGATGPIPDSLTAYINDRFARETEYIDDLFQQLKDLRKDGDADEIANQIKARADGYTGTLEGVYDYARLSADLEILLTFDGPDGSKDHICQKTNGTCVQLKGQTHPAKWWIENDLIPARGNTNYDCGGWNCQHYLRDADGNRWSKVND